MHLEIIWSTHEQYIIRDVCQKMIKDVRQFMFEKYFTPHRLFRHLKINLDRRASEQYLSYLDFILQDGCSMVVIDGETDEIKAVALLKCMTEEDYSWTFLKFLLKESKFSDIIDLHFNMMLADEEQISDATDCLYMFEFYIDQEIRPREDLMSKFFRAVTETARHLKMPRVASLALSLAEQELFAEYNYFPLSRALYSNYTYNNRRSFASLREIDESEAVLYEMPVDQIVPYAEWRVRGVDIAYYNKEEVERPSVTKKRLKSLQFGTQNLETGIGNLEKNIQN